MTDSEKVIVSANLGEFFRDEITDACETLKVDISDTLEFYLVNMLCHNARARIHVLDEPVALIYKRALEANPSERIKILKELGDETLFIAGFFVEFLERSLVDIDYYVSMGGFAYRNLSDLVALHRDGDVFAELYRQLSERFVELVDLLTSVAEKARDQQRSPLELLKIYDRWVRTDSARMRRLLMDNGLIPVYGLPKKHLN